MNTFPDWEVAITKEPLSSSVTKLVSEKLGLESEQINGVVVALLQNGDVKIWGDNTDTVALLTPTRHDPIADIRILNDVLITLSKNGQLNAWGNNAEQINQYLSTLPTIERFASGYSFAISTLGLPVSLEKTMEFPAELKPIVDIEFCGYNSNTGHCIVAIQQDGEIRVWGSQILTPKYYELDIKNSFAFELEPLPSN